MDNTAAQFIAEHRLGKRRLPQLDARIAPETLDAGYALQEAANAILSRNGLGRPAGHKVGATNPVLQRRLGVPHPVAGAVFDSTVHQRAARLHHADYVRPGVECELVALLGSDLPARAAPYTRAEVERAIAACAAGMEIIDYRYVDVNTLGVPSLIADNALDAGVVIGEAVENWRSLSLPGLRARTLRNGELAGHGSGADVMGDPIEVIVWLINDRARRGLGLAAGEFVFTGSMIDIVWVEPGDEAAIEIDGLGGVRAWFE